MIKKSFVVLATLLCGAAVFAAPGAFESWFTDAVASHPTNWSTSDESASAKVDGAVAVTNGVAVTYTAAAPESAYAKQTVTVTSEPLDELPATNDASLTGARFAFGVAQVGEDTAPAVYVLSKVDGAATWTKTTAPVGNVNDGAATSVEVTYDKTAQTFTVAGDAGTFTSLQANSGEWTTTSFVGNGAVNGLSGMKAGVGVAMIEGVGYDTLAEAITAAGTTKTIDLTADVTLPTGAATYKINTNGFTVDTPEGYFTTIVGTAVTVAVASSDTAAASMIWDRDFTHGRVDEDQVHWSFRDNVTGTASGISVGTSGGATLLPRTKDFTVGTTMSVILRAKNIKIPTSGHAALIRFKEANDKCVGASLTTDGQYGCVWGDVDQGSADSVLSWKKQGPFIEAPENVEQTFVLTYSYDTGTTFYQLNGARTVTKVWAESGLRTAYFTQLAELSFLGRWSANSCNNATITGLAVFKNKVLNEAEIVNFDWSSPAPNKANYSASEPVIEHFGYITGTATTIWQGLTLNDLKNRVFTGTMNGNWVARSSTDDHNASGRWANVPTVVEKKVSDDSIILDFTRGDVAENKYIRVTLTEADGGIKAAAVAGTTKGGDDSTLALDDTMAAYGIKYLSAREADETGVVPYHWATFNDPANLAQQIGEKAFPVNGDAPVSQTGAMGGATAANVYWWANSAGLSFGDGDWSLVIVAKLSATENGVVWSDGSKGSGWGNVKGFALRRTANGVGLTSWGADKFDDISVPVVDVGTAFHTYTVTYVAATKTYTLSVDGVKSETFNSNFVAEPTYYQFGGYHAGGDEGAGKDSVIDDFRIYHEAITVEKQVAIATAFQTKYIVAKIGEEPYYTLAAALDAVADTQVVTILDGTTTLPDGYTETCVISGTQAWKKRTVYVTNDGSTFKLDADTEVTLREGDTITYAQAFDLGNMRWQVTLPTTTYPIVVNWQGTDPGISVYGIPANDQIEVKTGSKLYLQGSQTINAGVAISGAGTFRINSGNVGTVNGMVTISAMIDLVGTFKLNSDATLKTKTELTANTQVVSNVAGKQVAKANVDGYFVYTLETIPPLPAGSITVAPGETPLQVVVTVPAPTANGQTVTLTVKDKNGTTLSGTHTGVVTGGQAVITIGGVADMGYTFEAKIDTVELGEGAFFTGNVWFGAYPHGTTETLVNGRWDVSPTVTDGKYVVNSSSGNTFSVTDAKKSEGDGKRTVMTHVVTFTSAIDPEDLPEVTSGTIGAITVAQDGESLVWKGIVSGTWTTLAGTPVLNTEYTVTVTYDPTAKTFTYAANGVTLGSAAATTGFSGVTAVGSGTIKKIEATVGDPLPAAEGYLTAAENGKPIRVDDAFASALVPAGDHAAVQTALNANVPDGALKVWQAYALGATADKAKAGVKPVISGVQDDQSAKMTLTDGFTVREHTGVTVTRTVKTKSAETGDWVTDEGATQNADGVTVDLPAEGAKAKYIKIEYSFE